MVSMKSIFGLSTILVCLFNHSILTAQNLKPITWEEDEVASGLVWKHAHTSLFDTLQYINVLEVDLRKREVSLVYDAENNRATSEMATVAEALAAVNAGFFDVLMGGSVTYIKVDGEILGDTTKWKRNANLNGAFVIKQNGRFEIELAGNNAAYTSNSMYDDVLITGSLLMDEGELYPLADNGFVNNRHPRTALGIVNKNKIILVTVDGRAAESAGMALPDLTQLMQSLGCIEAINLDGGGSTTMWIGQDGLGVVNMPSDNRQFDHNGERNVSNILVVRE